MVVSVSATHQLFISSLGRLSRLTGQLLDKKLATIGITYQEMRIAGLLMGEEKITQKDLAEMLSVRAATLSVAISKLESQGLVKRLPSSDDKRVNYLALQPSKKIATVDKLLTTAEAEMTRGISQSELATTARVLLLMTDNLQALNRQESSK